MGAMRFGLLLVLSVVVAGCQCFVPVDEVPDTDAGLTADAGRDAGPTSCTRAADCPGTAPACDDPSGVTCACGLVRRCTAGACATVDHPCPTPGAECARPSDCAGDAGPAVRYCFGTGAAWTCAFERCVVECEGGRTCASPDAGCLTCDAQTVCVQPGACPFLTHLHVEESTCPEVPDDVFLPATSLSSQACTWGVSDGDGGLLGRITFFDYDSLMADFPRLGGGCVGRQLPTGAVRFSVSCPGCMLSVRPEVVGP